MKAKQTFVYGLFAVVLPLALTACPADTNIGHQHDWGPWTVTTAPTCTTAGVETRTCAVNLSHVETSNSKFAPFQ